MTTKKAAPTPSATDLIDSAVMGDITADELRAQLAGPGTHVLYLLDNGDDPEWALTTAEEDDPEAGDTVSVRRITGITDAMAEHIDERMSVKQLARSGALNHLPTQILDGDGLTILVNGEVII
jgi:hypothetical protein